MKIYITRVTMEEFLPLGCTVILLEKSTEYQQSTKDMWKVRRFNHFDKTVYTVFETSLKSLSILDIMREKTNEIK